MLQVWEYNDDVIKKTSFGEFIRGERFHRDELLILYVLEDRGLLTEAELAALLPAFVDSYATGVSFGSLKDEDLVHYKNERWALTDDGVGEVSRLRPILKQMK